MAQVQVTYTATISATIELPDSKLKSLIVDGLIDAHKYIDIDVQKAFCTDYKNCRITDITIDVEDPDISSWETIEKNDGTQMSFDGYSLRKI